MQKTCGERFSPVRWESPITRCARMKIILATPLYPPEIEDFATYVKELVKRLREKHKIVIVAYASAAEEITGVRLIAVSKHSPLIFRIFRYYRFSS